MRYNNILVPNDASDNSQQALDYAGYFGNLLGTKVKNLRIREKELATAGVGQSGEKKSGIVMAGDLGSLISPDDIDSDSSLSPLDQIRTAAQDADLIVAGSSGKGESKGWMSFMGGDKADGRDVLNDVLLARMVDYIDKSVVAIPSEAKLEPISRLLFVTTYSDACERAIPKVIHLAKITGARVNLVHFVHNHNFRIGNMTKIMEEDYLKLKEYKEKHFSEIAEQVRNESLMAYSALPEAIYKLTIVRKYSLGIIAKNAAEVLGYFTGGKLPDYLIPNLRFPFMYVQS